MKAKPVFRKREGGILLIHESVCLYIHGLEVDVSGQWTLFKPIPHQTNFIPEKLVLTYRQERLKIIAK